MWETLLYQLIQNAIVPEVAAFIKKQFEETGKWPTKAELEIKVFNLAQEIKREGIDFLNRKD